MSNQNEQAQKIQAVAKSDELSAYKTLGLTLLQLMAVVGVGAVGVWFVLHFLL